MRRAKIKNAEEVKRLTLAEAKKSFLQHCKIKNLSENTVKYYTEDIDYFFSRIEHRYIREVTIDVPPLMTISAVSFFVLMPCDDAFSMSEPAPEISTPPSPTHWMP